MTYEPDTILTLFIES